MNGPADSVTPLNAVENAFWRALMRVVMSLPRALDEDLVRSVGINGNEYLTLLALSEAPDRELRMTDLARASGLSSSRITRLVDELQLRRLVTKRSSAVDARGNVSCLTTAGRLRLDAARKVHVPAVRNLVFDHFDDETRRVAALALSEIAAGFDSRP